MRRPGDRAATGGPRKLAQTLKAPYNRDHFPVPPLPDQIGGYKVIQALGKGGMGAVYLAQDPAIGRLVAIKLLREGLDNPELRERFARELRARLGDLAAAA